MINIKRMCSTTKWFPELQKSIVVDIFERDPISGERGLNLLASSEVEMLRADVQVTKRKQEICTYVAHFILRNRRMPEDTEHLMYANMYDNLYNQSFIPLNMVKAFKKMMSDSWDDSDQELKNKVKKIVTHWGCQWVELP